MVSASLASSGAGLLHRRPARHWRHRAAAGRDEIDAEPGRYSGRSQPWPGSHGIIGVVIAALGVVAII